ncbi:MAG TPA: hypothetical protein VMY18_04450 [Acidobacteriota bacterium]|nr:hypothetical protein [Acidobacteriota bacterium]
MEDLLLAINPEGAYSIYSIRYGLLSNLDEAGSTPTFLLALMRTTEYYAR